MRSPRGLGEAVTESVYIDGRGLLDTAIRLGGAVGLAATRPAAGAVSAGLRLERAARGAAGRRLSDAALTALDAALVSPLAEEAVDRAMASGLARHAIGRAFDGPLVDAIAEDLVRYAVVERVVDQLLADGIIEHTVSRVLDGPELDTDALVRFQLVARREGARVRLCNPSDELRVLLQFTGLAEVLELEPRRQSHRRAP